MRQGGHILSIPFLILCADEASARGGTTTYAAGAGRACGGSGSAAVDHADLRKVCPLSSDENLRPRVGFLRCGKPLRKVRELPVARFDAVQPSASGGVAPLTEGDLAASPRRQGAFQGCRYFGGLGASFLAQAVVRQSLQFATQGLLQPAF